MKTSLGLYREAAIYAEKIDPSKGRLLGSKVIAEAFIPGHENLKVDFIEEAATQEEALKKIKKAIDTYLASHDIDKFEKTFTE